MVDWMPWLITAVVTCGSLIVATVAIVSLARLNFELGAKLAELSTRKPYYLLDVEKGARGVRQVVRMEPDTRDDEGVARSDEAPPPDARLVGLNEEIPDPDEVIVGSRT